MLGISFGHLLYCYCALFDWAGWWRRLGGPMPLEPGAGASMSGPSVLQYAVAVAVIGGNLAFGALRIGNGWPFACYPRFDVLHTPMATSYVVTATTSDGRAVRLHDAELGGPQLGRHFYNLFRANQARVSGLDDVDGRLRRWQLLCTFVWAHHPAMKNARDVTFLLDDLDLSAGPGHPRRLGERSRVACDRP
jgi:hypothetical protein